MSLNCIEIEEIIKTFPKNGIIKKFYQDDKSAVIINIFDGNNDHFILVDLKDNCNRICIIPTGFEINKNQSRFSEVLNANLAGSKLIEVYQYFLSRIIVFKINYYGKNKFIVFRLWGNGSNALLIDADNVIIDVLRRMPKRDEWPGELFEIEKYKSDKDKSSFKIRDEFNTEEINKNVFLYYHNLITNELLINKKKHLELILNNEINKLKDHLIKIDNNINSDTEEKYKIFGELLKSNIHLIKKGMTTIEVDDFTGGKTIIPLQVNLNAGDNVNRYFNKYKKIKNGRIIWEKEKTNAANKLNNYLDYLERLKTADNLFDLNKLETDIKKITNKINKAKNNDDSKIPARIFNLSNNYKAYVSKSAKDADRMLAKIANGNDYWFHVRDYPGCHVVVKQIKNSTLPEAVKIEASNLSIIFSKAKNSEFADIHFTLVKYLHKSSNKSGLVFPTQEKNLRIKFDKSVIDRIFNNNTT